MTSTPTRRTVIAGIGALGRRSRHRIETRGGSIHDRRTPSSSSFNGKITTLDRQNPEAQAVAVRDGRFAAVGSDREVMALAGADTKRVDLRGRRVIPGLIDSHMHIIRGGLNYNMELRWDGVRSLADAMAHAESSRWTARRRRNGSAWSAASPSISSRRSACPPSTRSTRSRRTRRCSFSISMTGRC